MASFEEKVKALQRLRDRRVARATEAAQNQTIGGAVVEKEDEETISPVVKQLTDKVSSVSKAHGGTTRDPDGSTNNAVSDVGGADALFCAGHCCEHGLHGCTVDATAAAKLYQCAAEQGHTAAQWRLGELCEYGRGLVQNEEQAVYWYRLAAESGHAQAQSNLALLLEDGRGAACDYVEAFRWHLAAAEQGHALSQYCAACCLAEGRGVVCNEMEAQNWLHQSAAAGFGPAVRAIAKNSPTTESLVEGGVAGDEDDCRVDGNHGNEDDSLLNLAERLARQLKDLDDADAEAVLDELLAEDIPLVDDFNCESQEVDKTPFCPPSRDVPAV